METRTTMAMKKSNDRPMDAPAAQAGALGEFSRLRTILAETHREIPSLLTQERAVDHDLGESDTEELRTMLTGVTQQRQAAVRRRSAAIAAIAALEEQLQVERLRADAALRAYAGEAVASFARRYEAAVASLQALWSEADMLSQALRCPVPVPLPVRVATSPIDGSSRAVAVRSGEAGAALDTQAARLGAMLDEVDQALALIGSIRQAQQQAEHHRQLCLSRRTSSDMPGVYTVVKPVAYLGEAFARGALIDQSLIPASTLHKYLIGHYIVQAADQSVAA